MMKSTTITKLNGLVKKLVDNAPCCTVADVASSKKRSLFDVIKYAIRKESPMMAAFWEINALSIAKTPRQLNYVASEVEYHLRRLFLKSPELKSVWLSFEDAK